MVGFVFDSFFLLEPFDFAFLDEIFWGVADCIFSVGDVDVLLFLLRLFAGEMESALKSNFVVDFGLFFPLSFNLSILSVNTSPTLPASCVEKYRDEVGALSLESTEPLEAK